MDQNQPTRRRPELPGASDGAKVMRFGRSGAPVNYSTPAAMAAAAAAP